jgi:hypothetical protein
MRYYLIKIGLAVLIFAAGMLTATRIITSPTSDDLSPATAAPAQYPSTAFNPVVSDYHLPDQLTLCGEQVPLHERKVWEMLDREFNITVWDRAQVYMYLKRAGRYFPIIERQLAERGMPDDLKYLPVAESALLTYSRSPKGARGPWQFMTLSARSRGLRRDRVIDERLNFERSTEAALAYLQHLKDKFGSWALAMAAYNGGETRLRRAINEQKTDDFFRLNLPLETERYVFRIAAIKIVMSDPERYGYILSDNGVYQPLRYDSVEIKLRRPINISELSEALGIDYKMIKELNPHLLRDFLPNGRYTIHVPIGMGSASVDFFKSQPSRVTLARQTRTDRLPLDRH